MQYKSIEYVFKLKDLIDSTNAIHLWILSYAMALQDLTRINRILLKSLNEESSSDNFYYFKINIGHLREAHNLIRKSFENKKMSNYLKSVKDVHQMFDEIVNINDGDNKDSFGKAVLFNIRNNVFHYPDELDDFKVFEQVIDDLYENRFVTKAILSNHENEGFSQDYQFADEIQLNVIEKIGQDYKNELEFENLVQKISLLTAKIVKLLETVVLDFITKVNPGFMIRTR